MAPQREQIIYDHFSDPAFIDQLIEFLSLEDRKGKDKFSPRRFCLFKVSNGGVAEVAGGGVMPKRVGTSLQSLFPDSCRSPGTFPELR